MADEEEQESKINHPDSGLHQPRSFVEVLYISSSKSTRFAMGTDAGFAVTFMNKKLRSQPHPMASHIEAVKEGEEPIVFGPTATLVNFGHGWKLQAVTDTDEVGVSKGVGMTGGPTRKVKVNAMGSGNPHSTNDAAKPAVTLSYIGKIVFAFVLLFVFGAIFTLILENLPQLILYVNQSMN